MPTETTLLYLDALLPRPDLSPEQAWHQTLGNLNIQAIIANPPWGALTHHTTADLRNAGYSLARGQYDSYELFIELSLKLISPNGFLAFIIPDSIFMPEHRPLRQLLLENTTIEMIARLGEGWFPGIYRGTTVIIFQNAKPTLDHQVSCLRLTPAWRKSIHTGNATLDKAEDELTHTVTQRRFFNSPDLRLDIDLKTSESHTVRKLTSKAMPWDRWLSSTRGIELSKQGSIVLCHICGLARPLPRADSTPFCDGCRSPLQLGPRWERTIVRPFSVEEAGWRPLIVGEDVNRYACAPSRQIKVGMPGINYKNGKCLSKKKDPCSQNWCWNQGSD